MTLQALHANTPWWVKAVMPIVLSSLIAFGVSYYTLGNRVTALEAHRTDDSSRLDRIETKLDTLIANVKWALGSKQ